MTEKNDSLIEREAKQLKLLSSAEIDAALFEKEEAAGEYTAEVLFKKYPERYKAALSFLAEGIGILRIARLLQMSPSSVIAIREREPRQIEIEKARLSRLARDLTGLCIEAAVDQFGDPDRLKKMSLKDLGVLAGIMAEKSELLSGGATARIVHDGQAPGHNELLEYMRQLRQRAPMGCDGEIGGQKDGRTIDVTGDVTVGPAAGTGAMEPAVSPGTEAGSADRAPGSPAPAADCVSGDSKHNDQQNEGKS